MRLKRLIVATRPHPYTVFFVFDNGHLLVPTHNIPWENRCETKQLTRLSRTFLDFYEIFF
jgi:hypothetical protein